MHLSYKILSNIIINNCTALLSALFKRITKIVVKVIKHFIYSSNKFLGGKKFASEGNRTLSSTLEGSHVTTTPLTRACLRDFASYIKHS